MNPNSSNLTPTPSISWLRKARWVCASLAFSILAACGGGGGAGDDQGGTQATINQAPTKVALVEVSSSAVGALTVSWLPASDDATPASAIKYQVHASTDASFTPSAATLKFEGTGVTSATITSGLIAGSSYTVRLLALDASGASTASSPLTATISNVAASTVSGIKVQVLRATQVASVAATSVVLQAGVAAPAVNTFISSADANGDQGFLRKVVGVSQAGGITTLQTQAASINEVVSDIQVSSSFKMDTVPTEVANAAVQVGLATVNLQQDNTAQQTFSWPESGFRYQTTAATAATSVPVPSLHQAGLNAFNVSNNTTVQGSWGKVLGNNRIEISEGSIGTNTLTVSITDFSTPWNSSTPVGICKLTLGAVTSVGESSKPSGIDVSLGSLEKIQTVAASGLIKVANQTIKFSAATGTATDKPYKVTATAYLDDVGDGCSGGVWREKIDFELEIFVTTDKFPTKETASKTFDGSAGFKVKNEIVNTFAPKVVFDKTISGTKLTYARMGVQAVSRLDQVLTIDATAKGTMDKTLEIINPRKFFKVYMTPAGIPIVISGVLRMDMRIQGDVSGALNVTEKLSIGYDDISYGFEYKNGTYAPYSKVLPVYTLNVGGKGKAEANLQISLLPSLEITAYEAITGKAVLEPYLTASAGVEGFVQLDAAVDFDTAQTNMAADADYRLTKTRLGAGLNAWLYADLSFWEKKLFVWPKDAKKETYTTHHKVELMPDSTIMDLPTLSAFLPTGVNTIHPQDACAFKVRSVAADQPNQLYIKFPFMSDVYIKWKRWTAPRIIAPLGVPSDSYGFLPDPNGEEGVYWASFTKPGIYTVRVGGHSNWGTWARQYTEIKIDATDGLTGSAGLRSCASGSITTAPTTPTVLQAVSLWISDAYDTVKTVVWNFGTGIAEQTAAVVNGISTTVTQSFSTTGAKPVTATLKDAVNKVLGTLTTTINVSALPMPTVYITGATSDTATQPGDIALNGTTNDTTPALKGTLSAALKATQHVNIYDGSTQFVAYANVVGNSWTFTPATPLTSGVHSFTADVSDELANTGSRSESYVINISASPASPFTDVGQSNGFNNPTLETVYEIKKIGLDTSDGTLRLPLTVGEVDSTFPYIWIANSGEGTISKLATRDHYRKSPQTGEQELVKVGQELGRYRTGPENINGNPSRTTVDQDGNVWVGNRNNNTITKVGLFEFGNCIDRNGNGKIDTSAGKDDLKDWGGSFGDGQGFVNALDECVLQHVNLQAEGVDTPTDIRLIAIDKDNNVFAGGTNRQSIFKVNGSTGQIIKGAMTNGSFYGGLIDKNNNLWAVSRFTDFGMVHKVSNDLNNSEIISVNLSAYGIALDKYGKIWVTDLSAPNFATFNPIDVSGTLTVFSQQGRNSGGCYAQGVAVDDENNIFIAGSSCAGDSVVGHYKQIVNGNTTSTQFVANYQVSSGPTGVAVDGKGNVWSTDYKNNAVSLITLAADPVNAKIDTFPVGATPYNYSDMTGRTVRNITNRQGTWEAVFDGGVLNFEWKKLVWSLKNQLPQGTAVAAYAKTANAKVDLGGKQYLPVENNQPLSGMKGQFIKVKFVLTSADSKSTPEITGIDFQ